MWRELALSFTSNCRFYPSCSEDLLLDAELEFGVHFPSILRDFLIEADGLDLRPSFVEWDEADVGFRFLYPIREIVSENTQIRALCKEMKMEPADSLLFFASDPTGNIFAFPVIGGIAEDRDIVLMSHDNYQNRYRVVGSFQELFRLLLESIQ